MNLTSPSLSIVNEKTFSSPKSIHQKHISTDQLDCDELFKNVCSKNCYSSFKVLYERYYNRVLFYAAKYLNTMECAEEAVGDVFFKLWNKRKKIQINNSFKSYLYTSIRNRSLDIIRRDNKNQFESEDYLHSLCSDHSDTIDIVHSNELYERIELAINQLPRDRRRIFVMSRNKGMKYQEIANDLGISIKTVETQMGRSLKFLREKFKTELKEFSN